MSERVLEIDIAKEMRDSFLDYAMSVIVSRALPDVRDGLKPVQRRILYAMNELGMTPDKPYKKSAWVVGQVIAKYHPHGDAAVYDTMVRMAQDFAARYPLVDGHGNFGSIDGDGAAAMRYTEARLAKIATEMLRDIQKETIDFGPNYDNSTKEPLVLPSRFPNLLVNGVSGIAVGMATNIPPHNLGEVIDAILMLIQDPDVTVADLMKAVKGPDFPGGAIIMGRDGIRQAYETGRGTITIRAKAHIEDAGGGKQRILVTELPYQVNKANLVEKIAELARNRKIDGITDLRDESDRNGMRIVIELRRDVNARVLLNNLYKLTAMQTSFGIINLALVNGVPKVLNLKETLVHYLDHQRQVIRRRTEYDLRKAEARAHILEGLRKALDYIDEIIDLIRASQDADEARNKLMARFQFSEEQAQAIVDMRLRSLTGLEREKIDAEYDELLQKIAQWREILADEQKILGVIREELLEIKEKYGDPRRTQIQRAEGELAEEDLIPDEEIVITITHQGYIKRLPITTYKSQKRGGRGVLAMGTKENDFVEHLFVTSSHANLLFFTNKGKVYQLKAYELPELGRTARGTPIVNLLQIAPRETISAVIPIRDYTEDGYLLFATKEGVIKRTELSAFEHIRKGGLFAIQLREEDELIGVRLTDGRREVILGTRKGMSIRFPETDVRPMGRTATGVKGITLEAGDSVIDMDIVDETANVLVVTEKGYGKQTPMGEYRLQSRGGKGIKTMNVTERNGHVVALKVAKPEDDVMIITQHGIMIRLNLSEVSVFGRITQGVKLIQIREEDGDYVSTVARIPAGDD